MAARRGGVPQGGVWADATASEVPADLEAAALPDIPHPPSPLQKSALSSALLDEPPPSATSARSLGLCGAAGFWLFAWLINNMGVTLLNKWAFAKVSFPYPWMLSCIHMICNWFGAHIYYALKPGEREKRRVLSGDGFKTIVAFSCIFSANVAIGNASLRFVSVNFNQVARSLVPGVVMVASSFLLGKRHSSAEKWSLVPVMLGVAMATFGEMHFSTLGAFMTAFCVILAALKVRQKRQFQFTPVVLQYLV